MTGKPVLPHLHVHLEPGERTHLGAPVPWLQPGATASRAEFFSRHVRVRSTDGRYGQAAVLERMLRAFVLEQRAQGVDYAEVRVSPHRWTHEGMTAEVFLRTADRVLRRTTRPLTRGIVLINRHASSDEIVAVQTAFESQSLPALVGVDLAGDELRHPDVASCVPFFAWARSRGLGVTVHAGEFGGPDHIWRALDELGATRIGHGIAAVHSTALRARLAADRVLLELSVTANVALGAHDRRVRHPAHELLESGIPVCFNTDVPIHTGATLDTELAAAAVETDVDADALRALQHAARAYAFTAEA